MSKLMTFILLLTLSTTLWANNECAALLQTLMNSKIRMNSFELPIMEMGPDLWKIRGSKSGYIGSEQYPPFVNFLIEHSSGRYQRVSAGGAKGLIVENSQWIVETLRDQSEIPIIEIYSYRNIEELQAAPPSKISNYLLQLIEYGKASIANSDGGLDEIIVPVKARFHDELIASQRSLIDDKTTLLAVEPIQTSTFDRPTLNRLDNLLNTMLWGSREQRAYGKAYAKFSLSMNGTERIFLPLVSTDHKEVLPILTMILTKCAKYAPEIRIQKALEEVQTMTEDGIDSEVVDAITSLLSKSLLKLPFIP